MVSLDSWNVHIQKNRRRRVAYEIYFFVESNLFFFFVYPSLVNKLQYVEWLIPENSKQIVCVTSDFVCCLTIIYIRATFLLCLDVQLVWTVRRQLINSNSTQICTGIPMISSFMYDLHSQVGKLTKNTRVWCEISRFVFPFWFVSAKASATN